jgi:hypothetical protein
MDNIQNYASYITIYYRYKAVNLFLKVVKIISISAGIGI